MANFLLPMLGRLFSAGDKPAATSVPIAWEKPPVPETPKANPYPQAASSGMAAPAANLDAANLPAPGTPVADASSDKPEVALRQILKVKFLPAAPLPLPSAETRGRTVMALKRLDEIPALRTLAQGFSRVVTRSDVTVDEVVASIAKDQALCVRILRMANSVMVSSEQRISSLDVAVQMLGVERLRKAAEAVFVLGTATKTSDGLDWKNLWIHALGTAGMGEKLEEILRGQDSSSVYVAGLLHDVGKIVLSTIAPKDYRHILISAWNDKARLAELEISRLGIDHGEAGLAFANQNKMGNIVLQTVAHHSDPTQARSHRLEVALVSVANYLAKAYGLGYSGARLDAQDGEFGQLSAWQIIEEETGRKPDLVDIEGEMSRFAKSLRLELSALRAGL